MKENESQTTDQNEQPTASEQQTPAETFPKPVFIMRGAGMPFDEFKKICIQRFIDAGLIKEGPRPRKAGPGSTSNEQNLPDEKDRQ